MKRLLCDTCPVTVSCDQRELIPELVKDYNVEFVSCNHSLLHSCEGWDKILNSNRVNLIMVDIEDGKDCIERVEEALEDITLVSHVEYKPLPTGELETISLFLIRNPS